MTTASTRVQHPKGAKTVLKKLTQMYGVPKPPPEVEPIEQLVLAVLARNLSLDRAQAALHRLKSCYVDFNEIRVARAVELAKQVGEDLDQAGPKSRLILSLLKNIFDRENTFNLDFLKSKSKKEMESYFAGVEGADNYVIASVILNCCGTQAFPLDEKMLQACKDLKLAEGDISLEAMQTYLERQLKSSQSYAFCHMLKQYSLRESAKTKTKAKASAKPPSSTEKTAGGKTKKTVRRKTASKKASPK